MIKLFRKIRQQLFLKGAFQGPATPVGRYLLYALGEIVLVVIGILIALQINNWNTGRLERIEEQKSYRNIRQQIAEDRLELAGVQEFNHYFSSQYEQASRIITANDRSKLDSLALITMGLSQYSDFHRTGNIYETLVNSGDLRLLKNSDIPAKLQSLEMTYTHLNRLEDIHWEIIINELSPELRGVINYATLRVEQPEKLYSVELQNLFIESIFLTRGKDSIYHRALDEIDAIIGLIDEELEGRPGHQ